MGRHQHYRGALTEDEFYAAVKKTRMKKRTIEEVKKFFVDGEQSSSIARKQLMNNRIARVCQELEKMS